MNLRISIICCPFRTSFGFYAKCLKEAIERKASGPMQWVASNCGCGDPIETNRRFLTRECDYFDMPMPSEFRAKQAWKRRLRGAARSVILHLRAKRYANLSKQAEVVHFQQILNAYGSKAVFSWLKRPSSAVRIVTVHELDADQLERPETNQTYNLADAVIAHCEDMRQHLIRLGVHPDKVHVVLHGTSIPTAPPANGRSGIVFYAGHKPMSGKGIESLFKAMTILQQRLGVEAPVLKIHGHYGTDTPEAAVQLATTMGIADKVVWLNQIPDEDIPQLYQQSAVCVLPFTGSFAGAAASQAAACQLPIVCTRKAGLPDHLGDAGVWVEESNVEQLADRIGALLNNKPLQQEIAARLLKRAKESLTWDVIAEQTLAIYEKALANRLSRQAA